MAGENKPEKKKFGAKVKGLFGELKKVTWPSFSKVVSQTGVVLLVTVLFLAVLMLMDTGLGYLYRLLVGGLDTESIVLGGQAVLSASFGGIKTTLLSVPLL